MVRNTVSGNKDDERYGLMEGIVLFIGLFVCIYVAFSKMDSDLFFILNNGRYITGSGQFFPGELFSTIHKGFSTIIQQPLWSVICFLSFKYLGVSSIPFLASMFSCISAFLLFKIYGGIQPFVRVCLVTLTLILICLSFTGRPATFSVTYILFCMYMSEQVKDGSMGSRRLYILLPLNLLQLLIHATFFPIALFVQGTYLIGPVLKRTFKKWISLLVTIISSLVLSLCTPYGPKLPFYVLYSYGTASFGNLITELRRPPLISTYSLVIVLALILAAWQLFSRHADGVLLTLIGVAALSMHIRNLYLLGVFMVPMLKSIFLRGQAEKFTSCKRPFKVLFFMPFILIILYCTAAGKAYRSYCIKDSELSPVLACDYLLANNAAGSLIYTDFNMGAFLEFNGFDVYIDARPELYSKKINGKADVYFEFIELSLLDNFDYNGFIEKYGFDYLVTKDDSRLSFYLNYRKGYEKILDGNGYSLYRVCR